MLLQSTLGSKLRLRKLSRFYKVVSLSKFSHIVSETVIIYTWIFENRVSEDKGSFYYLAIKSNKIRPKADKEAYIWRRAVS